MATDGPKAHSPLGQTRLDPSKARPRAATPTRPRPWSRTCVVSTRQHQTRFPKKPRRCRQAGDCSASKAPRQPCDPGKEDNFSAWVVLGVSVSGGPDSARDGRKSGSGREEWSASGLPGDGSRRILGPSHFGQISIAIRGSAAEHTAGCATGTAVAHPTTHPPTSGIVVLAGGQKNSRRRTAPVRARPRGIQNKPR